MSTTPPDTDSTGSNQEPSAPTAPADDRPTLRYFGRTPVSVVV